VHPQKVSPRTEYRQQESQRIKDSVSLAQKFPELQSLTVDLACFEPAGLVKRNEMKYTANLASAKSVFCFSCPNDECVGGDFDLSAALANAIATQQTSVTGETICQGWRSKTTVGLVHCHHILRYKLTVVY
jgi:hypothetical protein